MYLMESPADVYRLLLDLRLYYSGTVMPLDRADAAIWGLTELMLDTEPQPNIRFFDFSRLRPSY